MSSLVSDIEKNRLLTFLKVGLNALPSFLQAEENNRLTLVYFFVASLDLLDAVDEAIPDKKSVIDYIYSLQVLPDSEDSGKNEAFCGFRGSPFLGVPFNPTCAPHTSCNYDFGHIAMTYVALALLRILGDDYGRVNRTAITKGLRHLQQPNGSFSPIAVPSEHDMRFVFCASAISYMLDDWSGVDVDRMVGYILASQTFEGAIAQAPGNEAHGGSTFCALAALTLCGRLNELPRRSDLIHWLVERQVSGFQGRPNKDPDTCYSFWVGASLDLLGVHSDVVNQTLNRGFTMSCQSRQMGGFAKSPEVRPDILHTYYSLCGLSLQGEPGLQKLFSPLSITKRANDSFLNAQRRNNE